jgi:uncharacterized protein YecE (DUF72 family)
MRYYVGTSGYYYRDWFSIFYPKRLKTDKLIEYYAQFFNIVEINSSFYRIPSIKNLENFKKKIPNKFKLFYKLHKIFTHQRKYNQETVFNYQNIFKIMENSLLGVIAQFPESFKYSNENLEYINKLHNEFYNRAFVVEFITLSCIQELCLNSTTNVLL